MALLPARLCLERPPDLSMAPGVMAELEGFPFLLPMLVLSGVFSSSQGRNCSSGWGWHLGVISLKSLWPRDGFEQVAGHSCPLDGRAGGLLHPCSQQHWESSAPPGHCCVCSWGSWDSILAQTCCSHQLLLWGCFSLIH